MSEMLYKFLIAFRSNATGDLISEVVEYGSDTNHARNRAIEKHKLNTDLVDAIVVGQIAAGD